MRYFRRLEIPDPETARFVVTNNLADAAGPDLDEIIGAVARDEMSVWVSQPNTFMVLNVETADCGDSFLWVQCFQGSGMDSDTLETVETLALKELCDWVVCRTRKRGVARMLERLGFTVTDLVEQFECMKKVRYGRFIQQKDNQPNNQYQQNHNVNR